MNAGRLVDENDGHDDAVDGHGLAENDGNEVFGANARRLDRGAEQRCASEQNAPVFVKGMWVWKVVEDARSGRFAECGFRWVPPASECDRETRGVMCQLPASQKENCRIQTE